MAVCGCGHGAPNEIVGFASRCPGSCWGIRASDKHGLRQVVFGSCMLVFALATPACGAGAAGTGGPGGQVLLREPVGIRGVAGAGPGRAANAGRGRCLVRAARRRARHS